jgi:O-antigen/teichoic acid export membrane protein
MLASFLVGVQLARGLGVQGYGHYGLALSIITIASIPGELGLPKLVNREVAIAAAREDYPTLFGVLRWADRVCWIASVTLAAVVAIVAAVLYSRGSTALATALVAGIPVIPFMALSRIRGDALQGLHYITLGQVPANLLRPLFLSILILFISLGGWLSPAIAMGLNSITAIAVYLIAYRLLSKHVPKVAPPAVITAGRRWLESTIPLALTDGMRMLQLELTTVLLGLLTIPAEVGLFRIAVITATMAATPMIILNRVNMPMISRLYARDEWSRLQKVVTYSGYVQTAGVVLVSLPLLLFPELLLSLVFGPDFAAAGTALRIISLGQITNAAFGPNVPLLNMTHRERRVTRAMIIGVSLNVVTVLLLGRLFGMIGGAVGFVVSLVSWNILAWLDSRRIVGVETSILGALLPKPRAAKA